MHATMLLLGARRRALVSAFLSTGAGSEIFDVCGADSECRDGP